ncbi:hypothetical protein SynROS8604_00843 [Synechococcus sp. ROS8604]|nr:hypothetical protein SynROS8604_00843 [Synechococcus sp. ROS8604]
MLLRLEQLLNMRIISRKESRSAMHLFYLRWMMHLQVVTPTRLKAAKEKLTAWNL